MLCGFVRKAEAEHVHGHQSILLAQGWPDSVPVPAGCGKAVDQQNRFLRRITLVDGKKVKIIQGVKAAMALPLIGALADLLNTDALLSRR